MMATIERIASVTVYPPPPSPLPLSSLCFRSFNRDQSLDHDRVSYSWEQFEGNVCFVSRYSYGNGMLQQQGRVDEVIAAARFMNVER